MSRKKSKINSISLTQIKICVLLQNSSNEFKASLKGFTEDSIFDFYEKLSLKKGIFNSCLSLVLYKCIYLPVCP